MCNPVVTTDVSTSSVLKQILTNERLSCVQLQVVILVYAIRRLVIVSIVYCNLLIKSVGAQSSDSSVLTVRILRIEHTPGMSACGEVSFSGNPST